MRYFDILASIRYKRRRENAAAGGGLGLMGQRAAEQEYQQDVQQAGAWNQRTRETFDRAHRTCMEANGYKVGLKGKIPDNRPGFSRKNIHPWCLISFEMTRSN